MRVLYQGLRAEAQDGQVLLVGLPIEGPTPCGGRDPARPDLVVAVRRVRSVDLWDQVVTINEANQVCCSDCWQFLSVEILGRPGNSQRVGLTNWSGRLLPMRDER